MRAIIPTLVGLAALTATSLQAAPTPTKAYPHARWHESPAQNVRKSQQYDYLLATNRSFRAYRMRKECGPIRDPELRANCLGPLGEVPRGRHGTLSTAGPRQPQTSD